MAVSAACAWETAKRGSCWRRSRRCSSGATLALDLPRAARGEVWGDGATYHAMAWSLALDFDLRFEERDLERIRREYPSGPQGAVPEAGERRPDDRRPGRLPVAAAGAARRGPAVLREGLRAPARGRAARGASSGRAGSRSRTACCSRRRSGSAFAILRGRGLTPAASLAATRGLPAAHDRAALPRVADARGLRPGARAGGLAAWAAGLPLVSAVLFGVAGYVKPPNLLMAAPLGLDPLLPRAGRALDRPRASAAAAVETLRRGAVLALAAGSLYALNAAFTGELNYQGGERKTFYGRFPFDATGASFDDAGIWMTTNQVGPLVAGRDDAAGHRGERPRARPRRDSRVLPAEPRLLLGRALRRGAGVLLPGAVCARSLPARRPARSRGLARARGHRRVVAGLHLGHPGQLVRRGRHGRQSLLPGRAARLPVPRADAARRRGRRSRQSRLRLSSSRRSCGRRSATRCGRGRTRSSRPSERCPPSSRCSTTCRCSPSPGARSVPSASPATPRVTRTPTPTSSTSWTTEPGAARSGPGARVSGCAGARRPRSWCARSISRRSSGSCCESREGRGATR